MPEWIWRYLGHQYRILRALFVLAPTVNIIKCYEFSFNLVSHEHRLHKPKVKLDVTKSVFCHKIVKFLSCTMCTVVWLIASLDLIGFSGSIFPVIHNSICYKLFIFIGFLARDSMLSALYAIANPSVCPSVRLSVCLSVCLSITRVDQSKTVERIIEILLPSDRPNILVFWHQRSLRKSDGFTPNGGAK